MDQGVSYHLRDFYDREVLERTRRPLTAERIHRREAFIRELTRRDSRSVLEVGCEPGRDGAVLTAAGLEYTGVDLSPVAARTCRAQGLDAWEADATALPFTADSFDAVWSMSTLMHLPDEGFVQALDELKRVVRPGGVVEVGVWGDTHDNERPHPADGRYFRRRTDDRLRGDFERLGAVVAFDTWAWSADGVHYQWARVEVAPAA